MNLPLSVRQLGLGNVSTGAEDVLAAWSNPAILMGQESEGSAALNGGSLFGGEQSTFGLGGGWLISPKVAVGGMFSGYSDSLDEMDESSNATGTSIDRSVYIFGGLASIKLGDIFQAGMLLKVVSDAIMDDTASGVAADLGVIGRFRRVKAGLALRNFGTEMREGESMPLELRGGATYQFSSIDTILGAEYISAKDRDGRLCVGVEYWPASYLGVRAGLSGTGESQRQFSLGLSGNYRQMGIDYAFATHQLGSMHRVSIGVGFGKDAKVPSGTSRAASGP